MSEFTRYELEGFWHLCCAALARERTRSGGPREEVEAHLLHLTTPWHALQAAERAEPCSA